MDSFVSAATKAPSLGSLTPANAKASVAKMALESLSAPLNSDTLEINFQDLYKSLTVAGKKIIDSLNEMLKDKLPDGIQSLKPVDVTPEATADRIVTQSTASFFDYRKQHPEMSDEDVLDRYMELVRGGVEKGYNDAFETLEGLGAFDYDGVQAGVEKTKDLIDKKLVEFEKRMRQQMGLDAEVQENAADAATSAILTQGGAGTLQIAA